MLDTILTVVVLSSGLNLTTCLAIAKAEGFTPYALFFRYDQGRAIELEAVGRVTQALDAFQHVTVDNNLRLLGGSALTTEIGIPKGREAETMDEGVLITYVPACNMIFLSFGLAWSEVLGSSDVYIGVNAIDYSGYPDCRSDYIRAFETMANMGTRATVEGTQHLTIHTSLSQLTKAGIIKRGIELGIDYSLTLSCYDPEPDETPCGGYDSCLLGAKGFAEAGVADLALAAA